ncbi:NirD/YgiW/YdeI family stress tolerance protein [Vibrio sp. Of14-4]|uniref:NirD/YgiW/YdeI family stress tolerance protein n=1 Tax=Vibrio tetraodonis subsp. pristinus TaxID=2695891 RepID=A0A6L8LRP3_9VIBR|nr:NirD/YgiW/YdeI family stress tolerance protein [Vibrio tetraodonis]MCG7490473.1 NirD/YgiW/YdeI family stress tolerance protein [Vibrio sp. Of14-4]MYM58764.1 NirD/YgiW/YdeI family stress tolerance protein [Vibrio tetraodonis subsp. pristinus]
MRQILSSIAITLLLLPLAGIASSEIPSGIQFNGPVNLTTVDSLLDDNSVFTKRNAILDGHIVRQISIASFIFSDGKREIQIEVSDKVKLDQSIDANTDLRIFGKFSGGNSPEIEVDHIQVL